MRHVRLLSLFVIGAIGLATTMAAAQPQQQQSGQPAAADKQKPADPKAAEQKPATRFVTSKDGTKIAYEMAGSGPAIMLLHGAGQNRNEWRRTQFIQRLSPDFTVIAVDLRGNGESDKPTKPEAFALERLAEDLLAVADDAGVQRFHVWGFAYGAVIARSLAATSDRVRSLVHIGYPLGEPATGHYKEAVSGFIARWQPIIADEEAGKLDKSKLSPGDYEALTKGGVKLAVAWQTAFLQYPAMEPADFKVPTLWLVSTGDTEAMASVKNYEGKLEGTNVELATVDGPSHSETLQRIDLTLDKLLAFVKKVESGS
jgi:pimeloyl-ACP methyl ester carboxylesterase